MDDPLALSPETMRATGYRMVDLLVERVAGVREWPALTRASPSEMRERLHGPAPEAGTGFDVLLATLDRVVRTLEPGEFFGELAALDWGADYG